MVQSGHSVYLALYFLAGGKVTGDSVGWHLFLCLAKFFRDSDLLHDVQVLCVSDECSPLHDFWWFVRVFSVLKILVQFGQGKRTVSFLLCIVFVWIPNPAAVRHVFPHCEHVRDCSDLGKFLVSIVS